MLATAVQHVVMGIGEERRTLGNPLQGSEISNSEDLPAILCRAAWKMPACPRQPRATGADC
eukprot:scaffold9301_cov30-Tisochrysis_lutea.AAC.8